MCTSWKRRARAGSQRLKARICPGAVHETNLSVKVMPVNPPPFLDSTFQLVRCPTFSLPFSPFIPPPFHLSSRPSSLCCLCADQRWIRSRRCTERRKIMLLVVILGADVMNKVLSDLTSAQGAFTRLFCSAQSSLERLAKVERILTRTRPYQDAIETELMRAGG